MSSSIICHILRFTFCLVATNALNAFVVVHNRHTSATKSLHKWDISRASSASEDTADSSSPPQRPALVGQAEFSSAIDTVYREIAKVQGVEYQKPDDGPNISYAIGRMEVTLSIPPGIDLIETPDLVLINGVTPDVQEQGVQPLDTIVGIASSDGTFKESTLAMGMKDMISVIEGAIKYSLENGQNEITVELNRLIKGYYGNK